MKEEGAKGLEPYRVLDLTDGKGFLCGKIFADLGADVIKVEPPGGDPARQRGPFYGNDSHPEKSLYWMAYNAGKRAITLSLETAEGRELLKRLLERADFLLESFAPGHLDDLGLGYGELSKKRPELIMASITPFGQTGPRARWKGPDLVTWAMGGYMWMTGEPGRAPLRISHPPQAFLHASAMAAVGCLMALHYRASTGMGQHVDVSAQQCPSWMLTNTYAYWDLMKQNLSRGGVLRHFGNINLKTVWPARDGHVSFMFAGGAIGAKGQRQIAKLMEKEGMAEDWLLEIDWDQLDAFSAEQAQIDRITEAFSRLFAAKEKAWLLEEAVKGGIMLGPINTVADVVRDPQLKARDFWEKVDHPEFGASIDYPGAPVKMSRTPWRIRGRAPGIGEHNADIFGRELGLSRDDLARLEAMEAI
ncbi:MAG: CoA transferase [Deltaproteobacteria bacterium]|nr:CoA transferase [Deltaproteobacteria bacterium]